MYEFRNRPPCDDTTTRRHSQKDEPSCSSERADPERGCCVPSKSLSAGLNKPRQQVAQSKVLSKLAASQLLLFSTFHKITGVVRRQANGVNLLALFLCLTASVFSLTTYSWCYHVACYRYTYRSSFSLGTWRQHILERIVMAQFFKNMFQPSSN